MELTVVPRLALRVTPSIAIVPAGRGATAAVDREVRVTVTNHGKGAAAGQVRHERAGWLERRRRRLQPVTFTREDESQTVRFTVRPAAKTALGQYRRQSALRPSGSQKFEPGYRSSSTRTSAGASSRFPRSVAVKVMDVRLAPISTSAT